MPRMRHFGDGGLCANLVGAAFVSDSDHRRLTRLLVNLSGMKPNALLCLLLLGEASARRPLVQPAFNARVRFGGGGNKGTAEAKAAPLSGDAGDQVGDGYDYYDDEGAAAGAEAAVGKTVVIGGAVVVAAWGGERLWRCRESFRPWLRSKLAALRRRFSVAAGRGAAAAAVDEGSLDELVAEAEAAIASQSSAAEAVAAEPEVFVAPVAADDDETDHEPETTRPRAIATDSLAPASSMEGF